jgi:hypothetical protein
MEWYIGMPPTDRRRQEDVLAEVVRIARTYSIDGLFLDFVRWPLHWEIELRPGRPRPLDSSFDAATLLKFKEATGSLPDGLDTVSARATWIRENRFRAWVDFKCKIVTDFVRMAGEALKDARPDAELESTSPDVNGSLSRLPDSVFRDLEPRLDWGRPMLYHNILLQPPSWIGTALADAHSGAGRQDFLPVTSRPILIEIPVGADWGPLMSDADWSATFSEVAHCSNVAGLIVFPGTALIGARGESLKSMLKVWV